MSFSNYNQGEERIFKNILEMMGWLKTTLGWEPVSIVNYTRTRSSFKWPNQN